MRCFTSNCQGAYRSSSCDPLPSNESLSVSSLAPKNDTASKPKNELGDDSVCPVCFDFELDRARPLMSFARGFQAFDRAVMMPSKFSGSSTAKHKSSSSDLMAHIPSFSASEHHTRSVSLAMSIAFSSLDIAYIVRMLCKRSAILIKNTRGSRTMSNKILRS